MNRLREIISSPEQLHDGLRENAMRHKSYNLYTSMDRALCLLLTGNLYISNGQRWNDISDREIMREQKAYGICMSCSTLESMAMWMLYSGNKGKNGAMIRFLPSVLKKITASTSVELGKFTGQGTFIENPLILRRENDDFDIFMTDVVYTDEKENELIVSLWEDHAITEWPVIREAGAFRKNYAWSYERESRLIVLLSHEMQKIAAESELNVIRIRLPNSARNALKNRVVRSPVYSGEVDFGTPSTLYGKVDWDLR